MTARGLIAAAERHPLVTLAVVVIAHLAIKLPTLSLDSLWLDEALSIHVAQQPLSVTTLAAHDPTPPLYYLLLSAWGSMFGLSLESARTLSVLLSTLTAAVLFDLGRRHVDLGTAIVATALFTASGLQLHYAHEARCYALVELLAVISFDVFLALLARPSWTTVAMLAITNAALAHAHYLALGVVAAQAVAVAATARHEARVLRQYAASVALSLLLSLPWLSVLLQLGFAPSQWIRPPTPGLVRYVLKRFAGSSALLTAYAGLAIAVALMRHRSKTVPHTDRRLLLVLGAWTFMPIALAYLVSAIRPVLIDRYVLYASLGLYLLVGYVLSLAPLRGVARAALATAFVALAVHASLTRPMQRHDWRSAVAIVAEERARGATLIVAPDWQYRPLAYYLDRDAFRDYAHTRTRLEKAGVQLATDLPDVELPAGPVVVVLGPESALTPDRAAERWLADRSFHVRRTERLHGLLLLVAEPVAAAIAR